MINLAEGTTITEMSTSSNPTNKTINLFLGSFILVSFLAGMVMNGILLWLLWRKMERTVNTLWFFHLTLSYLISCCTLLFFGIYNVLNLNWVFQEFMCKLTYFFLTMGMFSTVFLLTIISLDRYLLICHPIWSQHNRTIPRAWRLILGVWLISVVISTPYLAFSVTKKEEKDTTTCKVNYVLFDQWNGAKVELGLFLVRFLLAFLLPFFIILFCYCSMGWEMKKKRLARTGKPFRVLVAAVASFFIFRLPFYVFRFSVLVSEKESPVWIHHFLWIMFNVGVCLNICFTPILYLFVGEKFQQVFKVSIIVLLKKGFTELPIMQTDNTGLEAETTETNNTSNLGLVETQGGDLRPS